MKNLNALALGYAGAIVSAVVMLVLGIFGNLSIYTGAVQMMQSAHMFFSPSVGGTITGMIEAAIISFVFLYALAAVYNRFADKAAN